VVCSADHCGVGSVCIHGVAGDSPKQVGGVERERVILACSGMFGYISGSVTTTQYRAERTENRCRKRASNSHRPQVFTQDRMVGWVIDRFRVGWTPPDDRGQVSD